MHHSQLPLNLPLIARAASLVRIVVAKKKKLFKSCPGLVQARLCFRGTFSFHNGEGNNHNFLYLSKDIMDVSFHCERKMSYLQDMSGTLLRKIVRVSHGSYCYTPSPSVCHSLSGPQALEAGSVPA